MTLYFCSLLLLDIKPFEFFQATYIIISMTKKFYFLLLLKINMNVKSEGTKTIYLYNSAIPLPSYFLNYNVMLFLLTPLC